MIDITKGLKQNENRKIEFKSQLPKKDKLLKIAVAFSNSQGGSLIIGIKDDDLTFVQIRYIKQEITPKITSKITSKEI